MKTIGILTVCFLVMSGCRAAPQAMQTEPGQSRLQQAIRTTMAEARKAIDSLGVSEASLSAIADSMTRLASTPGLIDDAGLRPIHGNASMGQRVLASEGPEGINLYLSRFRRGARTPVHDHATWGVVHVLEGRDRHLRWERVDDGTVPEKANLRIAEDRVVGAGQSVFWLSPPRDIHSQEAVDAVVWELVMTGRDLSHATARGDRHWFDLDTGRVSHEPPK